MIRFLFKVLVDWYVLAWIMRRFQREKPHIFRDILPDNLPPVQQGPVYTRTSVKSRVNKELDQMVLQDALAREARAKAALIAVLVKQGCTEKDIEGVLKVIDGHEPGDGR